jgi:hypothetical protein
MVTSSHPIFFSLQCDLPIPGGDGPALVANSMNGHDPPTFHEKIEHPRVELPQVA